MSTAPGTDKAAMLLSGLPPLLAARVIDLLGQERGKRVRERMQAMTEADRPAGGLDALVRDLEASLAPSTPPSGAPASSQIAVYRRAAEQSEPPPAAPPQSAEGRADRPPEELRKLPAGVLTAVLQGERVHVVAMVLNGLPTELAAEVLQRLSPEIRRGVPVCLSRQGAPDPVLLGRITQALLVKAQSLGADPGANEPAARYQKIADLIRSLEKAERNEVLNALQEQEPEAAARVKDLLYQFEDLLRIVDRSMQKLLSSLDSKTLCLALKGASEGISAKVLDNLSMRAREGIVEELELLGSVPPSQVRQAQKVVVDLIQRLDQAGELQMTE